MGESNGSWGELARFDDELAEVWDGYARLPEPGENEALDAFVERKHIDIASLVRVGTRLAGDTTVAFSFPGGIKFRDLVTDRRWTYAGSEWRFLKIIQHGPEPSGTVIIAEGETDAARLSSVYDVDVAVLPAGAETFKPDYAEQLLGYTCILVGLDNDAAGERGATRIMEALPHAQRFASPANDWCDVEGEFPALPDPSQNPLAQLFVSAGELLDMEPPDRISWFEQAVLPVAGQLILHAPAKSFKSFIAFDMLAALAQGLDWACFEPSEEPCRVGVLQYEIPWPYYQQRVKLLELHAREPELFRANYHTFTPLQRPRFVAGNTEHEDHLLRALESAHIQVFLLDPVRRATGFADLNSEKEVRPLLNFYGRLQDCGITVVTCHHDNKSYSRAGGGDPLGMTGAGAFSGDADTIVSVSIPKGLTVDDPKRNLHLLLRNAPSPGSRGMQMSEDGRIVYSPHTHGLESDGEDRTGDPAI